MHCNASLLFKMSLKNKNNFSFITLAFTASILYWAYLFFISQMIIVQDALRYQELGELILNKGWVGYISAGPSREPFYPFLISISMRIAKATSFSFVTIQKFIQIIFLFSTQLLTYRVLKKLKIAPLIIFISILYIGFSPALINTVFCLFSEIAILPFIIATVLQNSKVWKILLSTSSGGTNNKNNFGRLIFQSIILGTLFLFLTFTKGIFEIIIPFFFILFFIISLKAGIQKQRITFLSALTIILCLSATYLLPVSLYKYANKKLNGTFALTNRASAALYGNIRRRNEKITTKSLLSALAFIPGEAFCMKTTNLKFCKFWSYHASDNYAVDKKFEFCNLTVSQKNKSFTRLAVKELLKNPLKQIFFAGLESIKMFFWETPNNIGFVVYPRWIDKIYHFPWLLHCLNFPIAFISLFSFFFSIKYFWIKKGDFFNNKNNETILILFSCLILLIPFIGLHSLFFVLPRYANPIAPLLITLVAFFINSLFRVKE